MKQLIIISILTILSLILKSQTCQWATGAGGSNDATAIGSTTDASGNIYFTGNYNPNTSLQFGNVVLPMSNFHSSFLAKYDPFGNVLWAIKIGNSAVSNSYITSITSDAQGNIYIVGYFDGLTIKFGNTHVLNNPYVPWTLGCSARLFIVKYDTSGNAIWAKCNSGTGGGLTANYITTDTNGNIYLTGNFVDTIQFGNTNPIIGTSNPGNISIFISKYDTSGNALWTNSVLVSSYIQVNCITSDAASNVYVAGCFLDTIKFGITPALIDINTDTGSYGNIFMAKYDSSGNALWAKSAFGSNWENAYSIISDSKCNIYMTGTFSDTINFGNTPMLTSSNYFNYFIAKYDSSGNATWAKKNPSGTGSWGMSISTYSDNNIYVIGNFFDTINFGNIPVLINSGVGSWRYFIVKYDSSGHALWDQTTIGTGQKAETAVSIKPDINGNQYASGNFYDSTIQFGNTTPLINLPPYNRWSDAFLVKYSCDSSSITSALVNAVPLIICSGTYTALSISNGTLGLGALWYWYSGTCGGTFLGTGNILSVSPSISTTYYVRAEGTNNTTNCDSLSIAVNPIPFLSGQIAFTDSTPCVTTIQTFSVISIPSAIYTWTAPSTWTGSSTGNSITYQIGPFNYDTVFVSATNNCGTSNTLSLLVHDCTLGIPERSDACEFRIGNYPNPFNQWTTIELDIPEQGIVSIDLFNVFGEHLIYIADKPYHGGKYEIGLNMSKYDEGLYSCRVKYSHKGLVSVKIFQMSIIK